MIILHFALALMSNMYMTWGNDIVQPIPLKSVQLGDNVTLECDMSKEDTGYISWYKQTVGEKPRLIVTSHKSFTDPHFYNNCNSLHFEVKRDGEKHFLTISQAEKSDSAFYYCGSMRSYATAFVTGVFLAVKGSEEWTFNSRTVVQHLVSDPVHPGDSVTLECTVDTETCAGEHSVYWFRHGSGESFPGLIYTHGNRSDQCDKSPEAGSPTHSCVYSLPKRNLSHSDAGIYYCAVLTCGDILFGNGTKLDIEEPFLDPVILALGVALVLCIIVILVLICTRAKKICCEHCTVHHDGIKTQVNCDQNYEAELVNYAALHISNFKKPRSARKKEMIQQSVYSDIRCTQWE